MSEPKPLSVETRADIENFVATPPDFPHFRQMLKECLEAEQYWREAVKNAGLFAVETCVFCGGTRAHGAFTHDTDCPWLQAQQ